MSSDFLEDRLSREQADWDTIGGLVLARVARLDQALEHLLKAVLAPSAESADKLISPDRSLGRSGAKIRL